MSVVSINHFLTTLFPLGLDESVEALTGIEPDCLLRTDDTDIMVVLVHQLEGRPLLWTIPSHLITDWNEMTRLLPENSQPPSRHLVHWIELYGPSLVPETAGRIAHSLVRIMGGWTIPLPGGQKRRTT